MVITEVEPLSRTRYKVYIDGKFAFVLYKGDLARYHLARGCEIPEETCRQIRREVVLKRAKMRALHLLNDMGRTEAQLRAKLRQNHYTEEIIEDTLAYVKSFGYVNDGAYARNFIETRKGQKSRREIYARLCEKGISREEVEAAMEECYSGEDSREAIRELLRKKGWNPEGMDEKERRKMLGFLTRKGFSYEDIRQVIQVSEWNA